MCAKGGAPTKLGMSKVGGYSYGSSQNHYAGLLEVLVTRLPEIIAGMSADGIDAQTASKLRRDLDNRNTTITGLRAELAELSERHEHTRRYALALHERLRRADEEAAADNAAIVRRLHPINTD